VLPLASLGVELVLKQKQQHHSHGY
jgi:hypothetical protein